MQAITFSTKGDFKKVDTFLRRIVRSDPRSILDKYGALGIERLREYTPKKTGKTADSWSYEITKGSGGYAIRWNNSNKTVTGIPIVILLQYGHGTKAGTWVQGRDFINQALRPVFLEMAEALRKEVNGGV